jgi:hypothetical protein
MSTSFLHPVVIPPRRAIGSLSILDGFALQQQIMLGVGLILRGGGAAALGCTLGLLDLPLSLGDRVIRTAR